MRTKEFWRKAKSYKNLLNTEFLDFNREGIFSKAAKLRNIVRLTTKNYKSKKQKLLEDIHKARY